MEDIDTWQQVRGGSLIEGLVAAREGDEQYADLWEHFSSKHTESELPELTSQLVSRIFDRDGSETTAKHPALLALWRRCNRRLPNDQYAEWLQGLILQAVPVSVNCAIGLYDFWTGDHGIVTPDVRENIRRALVEAIQSAVRSGDDLDRVLSTKEPYGVGRLIFGTASGDRMAALKIWREHLAPILADGARDHPEIILPELANLMGTNESGMTYAESDPPIFVKPYVIHREEAATLLGDCSQWRAGLSCEI